MRECYAAQPERVELFVHGCTTDLILRRDIQQIVDEDGNPKWECREAQTRYDGVLVKAEVERQFDRWWTIATQDNTDELSNARNAKLKELSAVCNATITAGVDVELPDGVHHFSMSSEDQMNLLSLSAMAQMGQPVPYHGDGEECRFFTPEEYNAIAAAATQCKLYHESYYNSMRSYLNTLEDIALIQMMKYGDPVPLECQTSVFRVFSASAAR